MTPVLCTQHKLFHRSSFMDTQIISHTTYFTHKSRITPKIKTKMYKHLNKCTGPHISGVVCMSHSYLFECEFGYVFWLYVHGLDVFIQFSHSYRREESWIFVHVGFQKSLFLSARFSISFSVHSPLSYIWIRYCKLISMKLIPVFFI